MKSVVVFDIDGTLANNDHREHYLQRPVGERDWEAFFAEQHLDTVHEPVADMLRLFELDSYLIVLLTGRGEEHYRVTIDWLNKHNIWFDHLVMRPRDNREDDNTLKLRQLKDRGYTPDRVLTVFEDRTRIVKALREAGYHVCQVAQGDF